MPKQRAIKIDGLYSGIDDFATFATKRIGKNSIEFHRANPDSDYGRYRENPPTLYIVLAPVALYAGKKGVDLAAELLKEWLQDKARQRRCKHREVTIYGPKGEEIAVVECKEKAGWKCNIKMRD